VGNGVTHFYDPETEQLTSKLSQDDLLAPPVSAPQQGVVFAQSPDEVPAPDVAGQACYPHCRWNCTQPVCNQDCTPECEQPRCQTRCRRPDYSKCSIQCGKPHCSVFCPESSCKESEGENCSSPKCQTRCARPTCFLNCKDSVQCAHVCHPPRCTWNCRNPSQCDKPSCRLTCEKAAGCARSYQLPPLSPSLTVNGEFTAEKAHWVTFAWGACGLQCGRSVRHRKVVCSTGEDSECTFAARPATEESCEDYSLCNAWRAGKWGECSEICGGRGVRSRQVWCSNEDENECVGSRPASEEVCVDHGPHCEECSVTFYGGPNFDDWNATVSPGHYNDTALLKSGVQCEDVSSLKVVGRCCRLKIYEYADFNQRTRGFQAFVGPGSFNRQDLEDRNVDDNDVSAADIWVDLRCAKEGRNVNVDALHQRMLLLRRE